MASDETPVERLLEGIASTTARSRGRWVDVLARNERPSCAI